MKVTGMPIEIGSLKTIHNGLVKKLENLEIRGRVETIQTTSLSWLEAILRRILERWIDFLFLRPEWKTFS